MIAGFVVGGSERKEILVRAAGPTLLDHGLPSALSDPTLTLFSGPDAVAFNDNWGQSVYPEGTAATALRVGAFAFADDSKDSAILIDLLPGPYTAHISSHGSGGVALFESYDAAGGEDGEPTRLVNLSTRGSVTESEDTIITGFVIGGNHPKRILVRGAGSTLEQFGVTDYLTDPILSVFEGDRLITRNDDWADYGVEIISAASEKVGAFPYEVGSNESAVLLTLPPGAYTAHVAGVDGATGESLVEVYEVD